MASEWTPQTGYIWRVISLPADLGRARLHNSRRARAQSHEQVTGSRLEIFANSGHFPQLDEPEKFLDVLVDFMDGTDPAQLDPRRWRELLQEHRESSA